MTFHDSLRFVFVIASIFFLCSCFPKTNPPKAHEINQAKKDSVNLINDKNAIMFDWYRVRLEPSYSTFTKEHKVYPFVQVSNKAARPSVHSPPLRWMVLFASIIYLAIIIPIAVSTEESADERGKSIAILFILGHAIPALLALFIQGFAHFIAEAGRHVPFHFGMFMSYVLLLSVPILLFMCAAIYYIFSSSFGFLGRKVSEAKIKSQAKKQTEETVKKGSTSKLKEHISLIMENSDLLTGNEDEDAQTLMQLSESISALRYDSEYETKRGDVIEDLSIVRDALISHGYENKTLTQRIGVMCKKKS